MLAGEEVTLTIDGAIYCNHAGCCRHAQREREYSSSKKQYTGLPQFGLRYVGGEMLLIDIDTDAAWFNASSLSDAARTRREILKLASRRGASRE